MSILGKKKATKTAHLLFVNSLWYPELQSKYSETKEYLHIVRLGHQKKWERNIMLYGAMHLGDYIPKPTRHKWVIYKRIGGGGGGISRYLLELLQGHESDSQKYPQLTKKYRLCLIPSVAEESWHVQSFLLKALSASSSFFCLAWWHSKVLLAFAEIKSWDHLTSTWTGLHLAKLGNMGFFFFFFLTHAMQGTCYSCMRASARKQRLTYFLVYCGAVQP